MTPETAIGGDVSSTPSESGAVNAEGSSPSSPVADSPSSADVQTQSVQDQTQSSEADPFAGLPSVEELNQQAEQGVKHAKALAELRGYIDPLKTKYSDLENRFKIFEPVADKFSAPEEIQQLVEMRESLFGWENDNGQLIPSTQKFVETLDPKRAEFLFADLADGMTVDPKTNQPVPRMDRALQFIATDPDRRANALRILGAVEPSAVAPQWQATPEQLSVVKEELQETFKSLPYDEREALSTNDPDFINKYLAKEKLQNDLVAEREQRAQRDQEQVQQREQMLHQEAQKAGDTHVQSQLSEALTTFHNSVVEQCRFIEPLDPQSPPQGMTAQDVAAFNQQAEQSNKAEAAQITLAVVGLINEQTRPFVLPLLQQIGVIDDKFLKELDETAKGFGNNARNYGQLSYRGKLQANGNGYQPGADVVGLNNEAQRSLKKLAFMANQLKGRLLEKKSATFGMKATGHNQILNGVVTSRPSANGGSFDPTTATNAQQPQGFLSKAELERLYG